MRKGHVRKFRKGFNTTHSTKITACSRLKTMVENDKIKICSAALITELKNFVATGTSFKAKVGQTDYYQRVPEKGGSSWGGVIVVIIILVLISQCA